MKIALISILIISSSAFAPSTPSTPPTKNARSPVGLGMMSFKDCMTNIGKLGVAGAIAFGAAVTPAEALTKAEINELSYLQVKGTGLAGHCAEVIGEDSIKPKSGSRLIDMCIEPKAFAIEEEVGGRNGKTEKKFVKAKALTRQTYTLDMMEGPLTTEGGSISFTEQEGMDYAATTLKLPGGQDIPMLFTVKDLVAKGKGDTFKPGYQMTGDFQTPSYRTGLFLDPKGRGGTTGYDTAVAFQALQTSEEGDAILYNENNKVFEISPGRIEMEVNKVNAEDSEIGGVFVSTQLADSDMGAHVPKKVLVKGVFYAKVDT